MALTAPTLGCTSVADTDVTPSGMSPASVSGLGIGSTVHSTKSIKSLDTAAIQTGPIGGDQASQTLHAVSTPTVAVGSNKGVRYLLATTDTADGAEIELGWVNRSGQTVKAGEYAVAVAA